MEPCALLGDSEGRLQVEREMELITQRYDAFGRTYVEQQIATRRLQDLRHKLLAKMGNPAKVWRFVCTYRRGDRAVDSLEFIEFQAMVTSKLLQLPGMDAERIFKLLEHGEGRTPLTFGVCAIALRFVAPATSLLDLRKCVVQRYGSVERAMPLIKEGLAAIVGRSISDEWFSVDES